MRTHLIVLIIVLLGGNAAAQTLVTVDVPFEFVVNGMTLPAGHYNIIKSTKEPV
ncbi:MAG TPA: hypothetical protein VJS37_06185 [Terriglobales bacterium]|jgi:hypothetical protein|nr:hypothetical protein [Terriglobales bacterium]